MMEGGRRPISDINEEAYGKMILKAIQMKADRQSAEYSLQM